MTAYGSIFRFTACTTISHRVGAASEYQTQTSQASQVTDLGRVCGNRETHIVGTCSVAARRPKTKAAYPSIVLLPPVTHDPTPRMRYLMIKANDG